MWKALPQKQNTTARAVLIQAGALAPQHLPVAQPWPTTRFPSLAEVLPSARFLDISCLSGGTAKEI